MGKTKPNVEPMPTVESHCGGTLVTFQRGYDVVSGRKNVSSDVSSSVGSLSVVKRTVERDLSAMQKKGVLIREGNTSAGRWVVIKR